MNFLQVSKVQKAVIPLFLSNKDVCVKACTGSGKTLAFTVPLVQSLLKLNKEIQDGNRSQPDKHEIVALILAPSRELAMQIHKIVQDFREVVPEAFSMCYLIGGNKIEYDLQRIKEKGCNVVVGTVGRMFDLFKREVVSFKKLEILVMDEADKILEDGHETQVSHIMSVLPRQRRTGLFSATMTSQLKNLIKLGMRNPHFIEVRIENEGIFAFKQDKNDKSITIKEFDLNIDKEELKQQIKEISEVPSNLQNFYQVIENQAQKLPQLMGFLSKTKPSRLIIFFGTCASVDFHVIILRMLLSEKATFFKLHGKIDQKKRSKIYNEFKTQSNEMEGLHQILLTTDLAARGIDIPDVDWIIQYDPPQDSDQFVHRIGRTARAGRSGKSLIYLQKNEESYAEFLIKKQVKMELLENIADTPMKVPEIKAQVQVEMKQDRDLIDKASNAFVSFVRYYKEHALQYIFSMKLLDIGEVANAFFLFRVPRVKEILNIQLKSFTTDHSVKFEEIPYKDKNKEKQKEGVNKKRLEKMEWKKEKNNEEIEKEDKRKKNFSQGQKKKKKAENDWNEWEELQKEENLFKKLKQGKINIRQFNKQVYGDSDFEGESD
ncbi:hypothetical protein FGO68_gene16313 [Halteria grandinella]|uniref:ATP-dependent RNA helicase n=1 Tax=Halteria grandinella TaxID=5974 RepID=A0A8J8NTB3_HALGN|nr:hypothetical protein FGO68_gene16313 [Halteria grandinella]